MINCKQLLHVLLFFVIHYITFPAGHFFIALGKNGHLIMLMPARVAA